MRPVWAQCMVRTLLCNAAGKSGGAGEGKGTRAETGVGSGQHKGLPARVQQPQHALQF